MTNTTEGNGNDQASLQPVDGNQLPGTESHTTGSAAGEGANAGGDVSGAGSDGSSGTAPDLQQSGRHQGDAIRPGGGGVGDDLSGDLKPGNVKADDGTNTGSSSSASQQVSSSVDGSASTSSKVGNEVTSFGLASAVLSIDASQSDQATHTPQSINAEGAAIGSSESSISTHDEASLKDWLERNGFPYTSWNNFVALDRDTYNAALEKDPLLATLASAGAIVINKPAEPTPSPTSTPIPTPVVTPMTTPTPSPTPVASLVPTPAPITTGGRKWVDVSVNQIVTDLIKDVGAGGKNVIEAIYDYIDKMRPGLPVARKDGARNQVAFYRTVLLPLFNRMGNDFDLTYRAALKLVEAHRNATFTETHRYRFLDSPEASQALTSDDRKAFLRLLHLMVMTSAIKGREQTVRQIDLKATLKYSITEEARQRVHAFYK
jgi:hypothetical protein